MVPDPREKSSKLIARNQLNMLQLQIITMFRAVKLLTFIIESILFFKKKKLEKKHQRSMEHFLYCIVPNVHGQIS